MDKNTAEEFQRENRPSWFLGLWSVMLVEARIVRICGDGSAGWHAEVDFSFGTAYVCLDDIFESKDCLIAAMYEDIQKKTAEIEAVIQTKDDCIRFMFSHPVSSAAEYTDRTARRAIQKIARKRWNLEL